MNYVLLLGLTGLAIIAASFLIEPALTWAAGRWNFGERLLPAIVKRSRTSFRVLILVFGTTIVFASFDSSESSWKPAADHALRIALIAAFTWLLIDIVRGIEDVAVGKLTAANALEDVRYRRAVTQVTLLRRLAAALIALIGIAFVLRTFPSFSGIGTTLIASAGLLSIVAGIAAQTSLTNVFAGIQLAISNELRVGDIVSVDGQSGIVHEMTLTYVVVQLWWDRSLVLPASYFITHPFENWTRSRGTISGRLHIEVDWTTPVDELRAELERVVQGSSLWDRRLARMRVVDAVGSGPIRLAIDLSAADTDSLFALDAHVREALVSFIVRRNPGWMPRIRYQASAGAAESPPPT